MSGRVKFVIAIAWLLAMIFAGPSTTYLSGYWLGVVYLLIMTSFIGWVVTISWWLAKNDDLL